MSISGLFGYAIHYFTPYPYPNVLLVYFIGQSHPADILGTFPERLALATQDVLMLALVVEALGPSLAPYHHLNSSLLSVYLLCSSVFILFSFFIICNCITHTNTGLYPRSACYCSKLF